MSSLSLYDIGMQTWPRVKCAEASVHDWLRYLNLNRDDIRVIVNAGKLEGMLIASVIDDTLYAKEFVTLTPGVFNEFVSRLPEIFGHFTKISYKRRGRPVTISYKRLLRLKHI